MERTDITLSDETRPILRRMLDDLPDGTRIKIEQSKRTLKQNKTMWPMLTDISEQVLWYGQTSLERDTRYPPEDWKNILTASLRKSGSVPTVDYDGLVPLGLYTSEMAVDVFAELLEFIRWFGDREGVRWSAPKWLEAMAGRQRPKKGGD